MAKHLIVSLLIIAVIIGVIIGRSCAGQQLTDQDWASQRQKLIDQLRREGITDERVLQVMNEIPRHAFIPESRRAFSYANHPVRIGQGQTISQPFIVAYMCQELKLKPDDRVLEIGTGSGYHAAVMSRLCSKVYTIEIIPELMTTARQALDSLEFENIETRIGDGYIGWAEEAPFDAVILTAAPPEIPEPLKQQLNVGGRLIAPVGINWQELVLVERTGSGYTEKKLLPVAFVPMTGKAQEERKK